MTQTSYPFENVDTSESQFSAWADALSIGSGVVPSGNRLALSNVSGGLSVDIASGKAVVRGHFYNSTAVENVAVPAASSGKTRYDYIVLELDPTANTILLKRVAGVEATSGAVPPTLTQTEAGIYQMPLWLLTIATVVVAQTDLRRSLNGNYASPILANTGIGDIVAEKAHANNIYFIDFAASNINVNAGVFAPGDRIDYIVNHNGGGAQTFVAGSGVTINSEGAKYKLKGQYKAASLICRTPTSFYLVGSLEA